MASKTLKEIVKEIQHKKEWTIEQVAISIGYSRVHLTKEMKKGTNDVLAAALIEKHGAILQNVTFEKLQDEKPASASSKDYRLAYENLLEELVTGKQGPLMGLQMRLGSIEQNQLGILLRLDQVLSGLPEPQISKNGNPVQTVENDYKNRKSGKDKPSKSKP